MARKFPEVGIHFTPPGTRCSMGRWAIHSNRVLVWTIRARFRSLTSGLRPRLDVGIILCDFDGPWVFDARTVMREMNRGLRHATAYVARAVEARFQSRREPCLPGHASHCERGFWPFGL